MWKWWWWWFWQCEIANENYDIILTGIIILSIIILRPFSFRSSATAQVWRWLWFCLLQANKLYFVFLPLGRSSDACKPWFLLQRQTEKSDAVVSQEYCHCAMSCHEGMVPWRHGDMAWHGSINSHELTSTTCCSSHLSLLAPIRSKYFVVLLVGSNETCVCGGGSHTVYMRAAGGAGGGVGFTSEVQGLHPPVSPALPR